MSTHGVCRRGGIARAGTGPEGRNPVDPGACGGTARGEGRAAGPGRGGRGRGRRAPPDRGGTAIAAGPQGPGRTLCSRAMGNGERAGDGDEARERALSAAWEALEAGDARAALDRLGELPGDDAEARVAEALARTVGGDLAGARRALARARELGLAPDDPDLLWAEGRLLLAEWRLPEARATFHRLAEIDCTPEALERLSFTEELLGNLVAAERYYAEAHRLDPGEFPEPVRLGTEEFEAVVRSAIEDLPVEFRDALAEAEVVVSALPTPDLVVPGAEAETPPNLLGLFLGPSRLERSEELPEPPPVIHLFQRNLEREALDEEMLREEIRVTLYHELAHHLGFEEEGVAGMGLD